MDEPADLKEKRAVKYEAHALFNREPSPSTKEAYKAASAAFNLALHHFRKSNDAAEVPGTTAVEEAPETSLPQADLDKIETARLAQNEAYRKMYADPNPQTKQKWREALNEYNKVRRRLDPAFAAKVRESARKSLAKKKG